MKLDIEKLFKENHRKMDEVPSKATWEKLRNRLDNRKTQNKIKRIHGLSIAAVVFAIISFGIVSMLYLQYQKDHPAAYADNSYQEQLQFLDAQIEIENDMYRVENVKFLHYSLRDENTKLN